MNGIADRLSRISALRPRSPVQAPSSSRSGQLIRQLGGEIRTNRLGCHVFVRSRFPEPRAGDLEIEALRLLSPDAVEAIGDTDQWLFLDTETTGLAGGTGTYAFLVGIAWWEQGSFVVEQCFMRDHGEESSLLLNLSEHFARRPVLITFNGKSYDWPLLQTRFQMTRAGTVSPPLAHLDLLHPSRRLWSLRLKSVSLTQLERHVLEVDRGRDIASETIPQRYFDFLRGGPPEAIAEVFRHNQMDLCGLASLALHISRILANPENGSSCAEELFGISRLVQRLGDPQLAGRIYRKALSRGLPMPARQIAQRELALQAKRKRDFELSNAFWEKLLGDDAEGLKAYEQLAIYYEHHAKLPHKAALLVREAIPKLQSAFRAGRISSGRYMKMHADFHHRLSRLNARMAKNVSPNRIPYEP